ncbi:MAG: molybdopterin-dependent oxidoreductase, partial [Nitrospinae bacterium]|nr:molybdopterin-dependent oxidoreductase [Nitrospinota bacterium]
MITRIPRKIAGWDSILFSMKLSFKVGPWSMLKSLLSRNSCKSCALGMGGQKGGMRDERGVFPSVCKKAVWAQASDLQPAIPGDFFRRYAIDELKTRTPLELEHSGRLTTPVLCAPGDTHYRPISWEEALETTVTTLQTTDPDRSFFYASGRSSNEAGFLLQLFARVFGTNNVNNCSYYCHQASGVGLKQSIGTGTATIQLDDLDHTDLIFLIGANPSSNHPRFMRTLMDIRRRGGKVIVINPARERGLEKFYVPSDLRSLLFGSPIASTYVQPHINGDLPLCTGIAKALLQMAESEPGVLDRVFIDEYTDHFSAYQQYVANSSWQELETLSGVPRPLMEQLARHYAQAKNVVFAWAMGITHHANGVEGVQAIVNLALLRGMVGRKQAGLLPLRGHSNVQGIGTIGFTPQLKQEFLDNLESAYGIHLPTGEGLDTLGCIERAHAGGFDFAWNLGGNLYGSNPDSRFAGQALSNIDFVLYMNTTLNPSHFLGRGRTTLILPVLARDEEPEPTTQESMFSYVRMSDGGPTRFPGLKSEVEVIAEIAGRVLPDSPIPWTEFH